MVDHVVHVHLSVGEFSKEFLLKLRRVNHITPKNYLDFVSTYTKLLQEKDKFVLDQCQRLGGGLTKLMEASEQIKVLNDQLQVQKKAVGEKSEACEILLKDISEKTEMGKEKKEMAQTKNNEMEEQNKVLTSSLQYGMCDVIFCSATVQVIIVEKTEAEAALEEALPALEEARIALSDLDKNDVTEIRYTSS